MGVQNKSMDHFIVFISHQIATIFIVCYYCYYHNIKSFTLDTILYLQKSYKVIVQFETVSRKLSLM